MKNEVEPTVLVTGFGPFGCHNVNASWKAVEQLPELLKKLKDPLNINLIIEEIPVAYEEVNFKVKYLWEKYRPSIIIHVGVSKLAKSLVIEKQANSTGYIKPDISNECPNEADVDSVTLKTNYDVQKICQVINKKSNEIGCNACTSDDAGRFLCEYIYYQSLRIGEPQVLFVHVPDIHTYSSLQTSRGILEILVFLCKNEFE